MTSSGGFCYTFLSRREEEITEEWKITPDTEGVHSIYKEAVMRNNLTGKTFNSAYNPLKLLKEGIIYWKTLLNCSLSTTTKKV